MKETKFFVNTGEQSIWLNQLLRAADLCYGGVITSNDGFEITVQWEEGLIVDEAHITKVKDALQKVFESNGLCVIDIYVQE